MDYSTLIQIVLIAACYFLFSSEFFLFAGEIINKKISQLESVICFFVVYIWFIIASFLELPLVLNWLVFLIILGIEVHHIISFDWFVSYALSMFCTIIGLATNIFFRSLMAILLKVPLSDFDNKVTSLKIYPILLGFLLMGILFIVLRYLRFSLKLKMMLENKKSLLFYFGIECCVYLFLIIQLLAYSQTEGMTGIKVWGIKSGIFSIIVLLIANVYTLRIAWLNVYVDKHHHIHSRLVQEKEDINKLWELAYVDILTGCYNRQLLDKRLEEYRRHGGDITIAFIDLNGLKMINDQEGHLEGDLYLQNVVHNIRDIFSQYKIDLYRYGGDEFIMMSHSLSVEDMSQYLKEVNQNIQLDKHGLFQRSISYGVVKGSSDGYKELIKSADQLMYQHKIKYYKQTAR